MIDHENGLSRGWRCSWVDLCSWLAVFVVGSLRGSVFVVYDSRLEVPMRALTAVLAIALAVPALAQTKQERPGIVNFTQVDAVVACGGATETKALDGLKKDGFKTIINLRQPAEQGANVPENSAYAKEIGLNYINIPF